MRELLADGFSVRATVRSTRDAEKVSHLLELGSEFPGKLQLFEADLLKPGSFDESMAGCQVVMHTASPFFVDGIKDAQKQLVDPALAGTRTVLESANRTASVERVIVTSSVAAVMGDGDDAAELSDRRFNESHWNTSSSLKRQPYPYSKVLAEEEAWKICAAQDRWDLLTINPSFVLGPSLSKRMDGTSVNFMKSMGGGEFRFGVPELYIGVVDVRDIAKAHVLAATNAQASGRHICSAQVLSILQMGQRLRERLGDRFPFPKGELPKALMYLVAPFLGFTWDYVRRNVGVPYDLDRSYSESDLGLSYRDPTDTLSDHIEQLAEFGVF